MKTGLRSVALLVILIFTSVAAFSQKEATDAPMRASLLTCYPGPEVYELCGHEALRIQAEGTDSVWNYGVFDFNEPNFVYRFVKGETDYMLLGYPFRYFLPEYRDRGSKVVEQELNLTQAQIRKLRAILQEKQLPENRTYRYNYIRDNCATRIVGDLRRATGDSIIFPDSVRYASFRETMRHYHRNYPWYQFGIDIALGQGIDQELQPGEQMFVPMEMQRDMAASRLKDGAPLIKATHVLLPGRGDMTLPPTPLLLTPLAFGIYILLISAGVSAYDFKKGVISRWWWSIYYGMLGLGGCVVAFLVFCSSHDSTSPNLLIFFLNPIQLLVPALIWSRRTRGVVNVVMWANLLVVAVLFLSWPWQRQSGDAAIFTLMATDLLLAATYAIISRRQSYNKR